MNKSSLLFNQNFNLITQDYEFISGDTLPVLMPINIPGILVERS